MKRSHPVLWTIAAILIVVLGVAAYVVFAPTAMDFAGGHRVALQKLLGGRAFGCPS